MLFKKEDFAMFDGAYSYSQHIADHANKILMQMLQKMPTVYTRKSYDETPAAIYETDFFPDATHVAKIIFEKQVSKD